MESREINLNDRVEIARLTSTGRGAVSSVGVRGERAWSFFRERWSRVDGRVQGEEFDRWTPESGKRPYFGLFRFDELGGVSDEIVLRRRTANAFEIYGHGGAASTSRLIEYFVSRGAALVDANDWERDVQLEESGTALSEGILGRIEELFYFASDALAVGASTERIAKIALRQRSLWRRVFESDRATRDSEIDKALKDGLWGRWLLAPIEVALLGAPNVGKSSLLNALLGFERSVVSSTSGTTRDLVGASLTLDGWNFRLIDAAGLRETEDAIEREGATLAIESASRADVVLTVFDCTRSRTDQEASFAVFLGEQAKEVERKRIAILNKVDLNASEWNSDWHDVDEREFIKISAKSLEGLEPLFSALTRKVFPTAVDDRNALALWTQDQIEFLTRLRASSF